MKILSIILTLSILLMGCNTPESGKEGSEEKEEANKELLSDSKTLRNDSLLTSLFNADELQQLEQIISFFDSLVINGNLNMEQSIGSAYKDYFGKVKQYFNYDTLSTAIASSDIIGRLLDPFQSSKLFEDIWEDTRVMINDEYEVDKLRHNQLSRYFKYLESHQDTNSIQYLYCLQLKDNGTISPGIVGAMITNWYDMADFDNESTRLFWAIHYITLMYEGDEKIKLNKS